MDVYKHEPKYAFVSYSNEFYKLVLKSDCALVIATFLDEADAQSFAKHFLSNKNSLEYGYGIVPYEKLRFI